MSRVIVVECDCGENVYLAPGEPMACHGCYQVYLRVS